MVSQINLCKSHRSIEFEIARHESTLTTMPAFADRIIDAALASPKPTSTTAPPSDQPRYILLHELLTQTRSKPQIRAELLNVLLAGRDTTASLLANVFFQLARCPDILSTLRAEVSTLNGTRPTYAQLKNMPYLHAIVNESLRLHPVVPVNARTALQDTVIPLGGGEDGKSPIFVPKGYIVSWNLFAMHRRKEVYGADAFEFRPGRWIDEKLKLRPGWELPAVQRRAEDMHRTELRADGGRVHDGVSGAGVLEAGE